MTEPLLNHAPPRLSSSVAVVCLVVSILILLTNPISFVIATSSAAIFLYGLLKSNRFFLSISASGLGLGIIMSGLTGISPILLLFATVFIIIAWDSGQFSITLGNQLGSAATTRSVEQLHIISTSIVTSLAVLVIYPTYYFSSSSQPFLAIVLLLVSSIGIVIIIEYMGY